LWATANNRTERRAVFLQQMSCFSLQKKGQKEETFVNVDKMFVNVDKITAGLNTWPKLWKLQGCKGTITYTVHMYW